MGCGISTAAGGLPDTVTPPAPQAPTAAAIWSYSDTCVIMYKYSRTLQSHTKHIIMTTHPARLRFLRLENVPDSDASPFSHGDFHMNACLASEKFRTPCTYVGQSKYGLPQFQTVSARESVTVLHCALVSKLCRCESSKSKGRLLPGQKKSRYDMSKRLMCVCVCVCVCARARAYR